VWHQTRNGSFVQSEKFKKESRASTKRKHVIVSGTPPAAQIWIH
jgi:hypothetical protein